MLRQWESDLKKGNISDFTIVENSGVIVCEKCKNNGRAYTPSISLLFFLTLWLHWHYTQGRGFSIFSFQDRKSVV